MNKVTMMLTAAAALSAPAAQATAQTGPDGLAWLAGCWMHEDGATGDGRDSSPSRCAFPMTALRLTPPNSSAIWLAVEPLAHIFFSRSIRSSVQLMVAFVSVVSTANRG